MRLIQTCLAVLCLCATVLPAYARNVDFNFNDDAVRAQYTSQFSNTGSISALEGQAGMFYRNNGRRGDDVLLPHIGLLVTGNAGTPNVRASVGARFVYLNAGSLSGYAFAPGGKLYYTLPFMNRLGFGAHIYYSPRVVSTQDVDNYFEYGATVGYEILRNARIYAGYRQIKVNVKGPGGYLDIDSGFNVGMHLNF